MLHWKQGLINNMFERLAKFCGIRLFIAATFVVATLHSCHHEHSEASPKISACDAHVITESCGCGHSHESGSDDHHHCHCICHIPSALLAFSTPMYDPPISTTTNTLFLVNDFEGMNRVERPPRLS